MKKILYVVAVVAAMCLGSCNQSPKGEVKNANVLATTPQEMNLGYLFDSAAYVKELAWDDSITLMAPYRRYEQTVLKRWRKLDEIRPVLGEPESFEVVEAEYGFKKDENGNYTFCLGVSPFMSPTGQIARNQRCYYVMRELNVPHATVVKSIWRSMKGYVELYYKVNGQDTVVFEGFVEFPDFTWEK